MKTLTTIAFVLLSFIIHAQSITPEVISSSGDHFDNGTVQLSYTVGEIAVSTHDNGTNILTEGFHQGDLLITAIEEDRETDMDVRIYPNPTAFFINLEFEKNENPMKAVLFDMNGRQIKNMGIEAQQSEAEMDVSDLSAGQYILKLQENGEYHSSHQIQKAR